MKLNITQKLIFGILALLIAIFSAMFANSRTVLELNQIRDEMIFPKMRLLEKSENLKSSLLQRNILLFEMQLLTNESEIKQRILKINQILKEEEIKLKVFLGLLTDPTEKELANLIISLRNEHIAVSKQQQQLIFESNFNFDQQNFLAGIQLHQKVVDSWNTLILHLEEDLVVLGVELALVQDKFSIGKAVAFTMILFIGIIVPFWVSRSISLPVRQLLQITKNIEEQNPLDEIPGQDSGDELVAVRNALQHLDISLRASQASLTAEKNFSENIRNSLFDPLFVLDEKSQIHTSNPASSVLLGYSIKELTGLVFDELIEVKEQQNPITDYILNQSGQSIPVSMSRSPIAFNDGNGQINGEVILLRDLREWYEMEKERMDFEIQARQSQKREALGTLAGGVAHDFNNILQSMTSGIELMKMDVPQDSLINNELNALHSLSDRAKDLVGQILTFSRYDSEKQTNVEIVVIIRECLKMIRSTTAKNIKVEDAIRLPEVHVMGNATQIHQIMLNLCINASHAMDEFGGTITVKLDQAKGQDLPSVVLNKKDKYVCIRVQDTGKGMSPEVVSHIFEPFFTTKKHGKGTGLGLSVIDGIIEMHKGHIIVDSMEGEGTKFDVYLPTIQNKKAIQVVEKAVPAETQTNLPTMRILLVDDEEMLLRIQKRTFKHMGHEVEVCSDGEQAYELLKSKHHEFDLIITDQTMPGMTGMQLSQKCKELNPELPVILSTGYSADELPKKFEDVGIVGLLPKPYTRETLIGIMEKVMTR